MTIETCNGCGRTRRYHDANGNCGLFLYDGNSEALLKVPNDELRQLTPLDLSELVKLLRGQGDKRANEETESSHDLWAKGFADGAKHERSKAARTLASEPASQAIADVAEVLGLTKELNATWDALRRCCEHVRDDHTRQGSDLCMIEGCKCTGWDGQQGANTLRVRIAVAVNEKGDCGAAVSHAGEDADAKECALYLLGDIEGDERVTFVEANIPLPEPVTVEGEVIG